MKKNRGWGMRMRMGSIEAIFFVRLHASSEVVASYLGRERQQLELAHALQERVAGACLISVCVCVVESIQRA